MTQGNKVVPFQFHDHEVSVFVNENGEPEWIAKDVCEILGYKNVTQTISDHCRRAGVSKRYIRSGGQRREVTCINEGNLYRLIVKSQKPEAEPFETWVFDEVLPKIRKAGTYTMPGHQKPETLLPVDREFRAAIRMARAAGLKGNQAVLSANRLTREITGSDPLLLLNTTHLISEQQERHFSPTELGRRRGLSGNRMNRMIEEAGLQVSVMDGKRKYWKPTEAGEKYAVLVDTGKKHGSGAMVQQLRWLESVLEAVEGIVV